MAEIVFNLEEKARNYYLANVRKPSTHVDMDVIRLMVEFSKTLTPPTQETRDNYQMRIVAYECHVDPETGKVNLIQHIDYGEGNGVEDIVITLADRNYAKRIFTSALKRLET